MKNVTKIKKQINVLIKFLLEQGLADDSNFPYSNDLNSKLVNITFQGADYISEMIKNDYSSYTHMYEILKQNRAYSIKMLDGAFIQMTYSFRQDVLESHRLGFFPSPELEQFQNNPDIYSPDEIHSEFTSKNIAPCLIRFDFDTRDNVHKIISHPKSHLTLGQYTSCRIPVSHPISPFHFIEFIIRNFYSSDSLENRLNSSILHGIGNINFNKSMVSEEEKIIHMQVPL
jgi:hypothetical protein